MLSPPRREERRGPGLLNGRWGGGQGRPPPLTPGPLPLLTAFPAIPEDAASSARGVCRAAARPEARLPRAKLSEEPGKSPEGAQGFLPAPWRGEGSASPARVPGPCGEGGGSGAPGRGRRRRRHVAAHGRRPRAWQLGRAPAVIRPKNPWAISTSFAIPPACLPAPGWAHLPLGGWENPAMRWLHTGSEQCGLPDMVGISRGWGQLSGMEVSLWGWPGW